MPEVIAETLVAVRPDTKGFSDDLRKQVDRAVNTAEKQVDGVDVPVNTRSFAAKATDLGNILKAAVSVEAIRTGAQIVGALATASSDLNEAQNAVNVTFTSGAHIIEDFADNAAASLGLTETAALQLSGSFGGLFTNIGLAGDQAAVLSRGVLQLGADLASLKNLRTEDALEKIRSGLTGEVEPLRSVGVFLSEAAVKSKALELGLGGAHGELSEGEKVMARYSLIMEQLDEAQGDFANTSDSLANAQRIARASMGDLAATAGGLLAPAIADTAASVGILSRAIDDLVEKAGGGQGGLGKVVNFLFKAITPLGSLVGAIDKANDVFGDGADTTDIYAETADQLPGILDAVANAGGNATGAIEAVTKAQVSAIEANLGYADTQDRLDDAQRAVTEAQQDYSDALAGSGKYAEDLTAATDKLRSAQEGLATAQRKVRDLSLDIGEAQEDLAAAQIRYGVGSKEARDAARDLQSKQEDLAEANGDVAEAADDVAKAEADRARVRDLSDERRESAEKLTDAQRNLERAVYNAAKQEVELGVQTAAARGETITATQQTDLLRGAIERLRDTAIPADSPLRSSLAELLGMLAPAGQSAFESFRAGERAAGEVAPVGTTGGGNWSTNGSSTTTGTTTPVRAQSAGPAIGQVVINYPIDFEQLLEQAEYAAGIGN